MTCHLVSEQCPPVPIYRGGSLSLREPEARVIRHFYVSGADAELRTIISLRENPRHVFHELSESKHQSVG